MKTLLLGLGSRAPRRRRRLPLLAAAWWLAPTVAAVAATAAPAGGQTVAIVHGEVHPVSGPVIPDGTVLLEEGRIRSVGREVAVPPGAEVIDATGKVVTPGLIDSSTRLGVVEIGAYQGTSDGSSASDRYTAAFNVADGINPASTLIPVTRVEGITRAVVTPTPGASLIAGSGALINLGGDRLSTMVDLTPLAMYAVLGERGAEYEGGARSLALLRLREVFQDASDYREHRRDFATGNRRSYSLSRLDLDALEPVLGGRLPLVVQVERASDILAALRLKEEWGLQLVLSGAGEGWRVAQELARAEVPVMTDPVRNLPSMEVLGARYENVARMAAAGVKVILASYDAHNARNLREKAGFAVSYGLPHEEALRAVTLTPAQVWGVADRMGSLEPGKVGDVVVWSGDPFEPLTSAEHVFINGREISYETRQKALLERYRTLDGRPPWRRGREGSGGGDS